MNFTNKLKVKIIALLSSILVWVYVTSTVDPLESKTFKNIPITINNSHSITEKGLTIFPEETLTADITIKTNISKLRKINRDTIIIYADITNPSPGKNIVTFSSNLSDNISHDIEPNTNTINLETIETVEKDITIIANKKYTNDEYTISIEKNKIDISGTKTLINKVDKVIGTMKSTETSDNFSETIELVPIDINGDKIEGIKLSFKYVGINVTKNKIPEELETNTNEIKEEKKDNETKENQTK